MVYISLLRNTLTITNHVRQFVYEDLFFVSQFYRDLKMTTDGSQQNHIEFLKCVIVVTFTEVLRIVADWM